MSEGVAREIIATVRIEVEEAVDVMLSAAEEGLRDLATARAGGTAAFDGVERALCAIMEACAFQDLTGQRLTKLEAMIGATSLQVMPGDPLLEGPAAPGQGLSQTAADALMGRASQ